MPTDTKSPERFQDNIPEYANTLDVQLAAAVTLREAVGGLATRSAMAATLRNGETLILMTLRTSKSNLGEMNLICVLSSGRKGSARSPI